MDWTLRELRYFTTVVDAGSFTEGAARLYVSQAAASRTVASLERRLGARLLRRVPAGCVPTQAGWQLLPAARRVLAEAERFTEFARSRREVLRVGYAWAALGVHTAALQRGWATGRLGVDLEIFRGEAADAGLSDGRCDVAIVRRPLDDPRYSAAVVGYEQRVVAFAEDDVPWARRRRLSLAEIAERTVIIDTRAGTTDAALWGADGPVPEFLPSSNVDQWLDLIAAGRGVGITAEATSHHHRRDGVRYRRIADAAPVPVQLVWRRGDAVTGLDALIERTRQLYGTDADAR